MYCSETLASRKRPSIILEGREFHEDQQTDLLDLYHTQLTPQRRHFVRRRHW
jgi:hypothetical protein